MMRNARETPRVAILVACHNDGTTIGETIESLRHEERTELLVIDDGSADPTTLEALAALERAGVRVLRQDNAGPASAWMRGLGATSAPYVMPFSSDDILVRGAAGRLADALDAEPRAAAAWGDLQSFGSARAYVPSTPVLCPWHVTYVNPLPGIALFRRGPLLAVGGWQLRRGIEDWDLWMRFAAHGLTGVYLPLPVFYYRRDAGGRFRGRVRAFDGFYDQLRARNAALFAARRTNRRRSSAPPLLKVVLPMIDRLPFLSRLLKVQLCELATLILWSGGVRRTARILAHGVAFRARLLRRP